MERFKPSQVYYSTSVGVFSPRDGWYEFGISIDEILGSQDRVFNSAVKNFKFLTR